MTHSKLRQFDISILDHSFNSIYSINYTGFPSICLERHSDILQAKDNYAVQRQECGESFRKIRENLLECIVSIWLMVHDKIQYTSYGNFSVRQ